MRCKFHNLDGTLEVREINDCHINLPIYCVDEYGNSIVTRRMFKQQVKIHVRTDGTEVTELYYDEIRD